MCGYCTEDLAIEIAIQESKGIQFDFLNDDARVLEMQCYFYLQETNDIEQSIDHFNKNKGLYDNELLHEIILCRIIGSLFINGFRGIHNNLIEKKIVSWALRHSCSSEIKSRICKSKFSYIKDTPLMNLYDINTFQLRKKTIYSKQINQMT
jgi:hypothetical protein